MDYSDGARRLSEDWPGADVEAKASRGRGDVAADTTPLLCDRQLTLYGIAVYPAQMWQAVIETPTYLRDAEDAGLSEADRDAIVMFLAANPDAGVVIRGTGGARKVRFAGRGKGKSGGYRVITFFSGPEIPVFLLAMLSKGERADLSQNERNELKRELSALVDDYTRGVREHVKAREKAH